MRQVATIKAAYDWMAEARRTAINESVAAGDTQTASRQEETRVTLDRAFFVLLFGQFETAVTETFEQARNARSANPDWKSRRGWDVPAYGDRRIPFETKLALVIDRRGKPHSTILQAYALRNHFAHGGTREPVSSIDDFVADLYAWQALLRR